MLGRVFAMFFLFSASFASLSQQVAFAQAARQDQPPQVSARAGIVIDYPSGRILYGKAIHDKMAPASTTKILTALLALQFGNLNDVVIILPRDLVPGTSMGLVAGEKQTLHNLLYGLLLPSGNDAAMAIARYVGSMPNLPVRSSIQDPVARFVALMNWKVASLKLVDSHFMNPHGLDTPGHYTSAYDLVCFMYLAMKNPVFVDIIRQQTYTVPGHTLKNLNRMLTLYPGTIGGKTGYTGKAGLCLVNAATRDGRTLISVVLDAPKWTDDTTALLDYVFAKTINSAKPASSAPAKQAPARAATSASRPLVYAVDKSYAMVGGSAWGFHGVGPRECGLPLAAA